MPIAPVQAQTATETVLHNFPTPPKGAGPNAGVIRDSAGNLYGTTENGGTAGAGVVFKVDTAGRQTVLYSFTGGADGANPYAGVVRDSAGNLYGTTYQGGTGHGVVYKLNTAGQETVLYNFTGGDDGGGPNGVILDSAGNLYGTTVAGGTAGVGVVYELDTARQETVLYSFTGGTDGSYPHAGVIRDSAGNLYGTTEYGGSTACSFLGCGVVYKVDTAGQETVLYSFTGGLDGVNPEAGVIRDSSGNLYGTTFFGVAYELDTANQLTVLYSFIGGADGGFPEAAGVIRDSAGNLYGTTFTGGAANAGVVYKLDTAGQETVLYGFPSSADGSFTEAGVIRDSAGNLYGTTPSGGASNAGVVYKLAATGRETVLYTFTGGTDGGNPAGGLIRDSAGNLYGTAASGGAGLGGVVYKVDTAGQETVLYSFGGGSEAASGSYPQAGVIRDSAGNLYGTTYYGGPAQAGVVYMLNTAGQETVLYNFTNGADGGYPTAGLTRDSAGNLYGTTHIGGTGGAGVVFKLDPAGQETVLYSFMDGADGGYPFAGVIRDSAGNLYGTASDGGAGYGAGVVYKVDSAGQETVLYGFLGGSDGDSPNAGVIRDPAGNLYGTTIGGGTAGKGVVYKLNPSGQETVLYNFTGGDDGGTPFAGVILDSAGSLYGTMSSDGKKGGGVVFKLAPP